MNDQLSLFGAESFGTVPENGPPTGEAVDQAVCARIALAGLIRNQGYDPTKRASEAAVDQGHGPVPSGQTEAVEAPEQPEAATATTHELIAKMRLALGSTGRGAPLSNGARHATRAFIENRRDVLGE